MVLHVEPSTISQSTISIVDTSLHLRSEEVEVDIVICTCRHSCIQTKLNLLNKHCCSQTVPGQPSISVDSTTATTISLSWSVPSGSVVDSYEVMWQRDTSGDCPDEDEGSMSITDGSTSYMITGLEEDSSYSITVIAVGSSAPVTAVTGEAGYYLLPFSTAFQKLYLLFFIFQLRLLLPLL